MSNFKMLDQKFLAELLDPFVPGMAPHIMPIKYEALTPDLFYLLFRTSGKDDKEYFFVLLEFDYLKDVAEATQLIENMPCKVLEYFAPKTLLDNKSENPPIKKSHKYQTGAYYGLLARVSRPHDGSYWASNFTIMPGDSLSKALAHLPQKDQAVILKSIRPLIAQPKIDPKDSLLETIKRATSMNEDQDINTSDLGFNLFKNHRGDWEFFYNHIPRKQKK